MDKPTQVEDRYAYWMEPPPEISARCQWWMARIEAGWYPNNRIRTFGYDEAAVFYGVYIWEFLNVIAPLLRRRRDLQAVAVVN